jgi:hypothetical protein
MPQSASRCRSLGVCDATQRRDVLRVRRPDSIDTVIGHDQSAALSAGSGGGLRAACGSEGEAAAAAAANRPVTQSATEASAVRLARSAHAGLTGWRMIVFSRSGAVRRGSPR